MIFYTIQYSCQYQKVIFYTDKAILVEEWDRYDQVIGLRDLYQRSTLIDYTEELLKKVPILNDDCISLFNIIEFIKHEVANDEQNQCSITDSVLKKLKILNKTYAFFSMEMEYETLELKMTIHRNVVLDSCEIFYFKKKENTIYINRHEGCNLLENDILEVCEEEISKLYDIYLERRDKLTQKSNSIRTVNSIYCVNISYRNIEIFIKDVTGIRINTSDLHLFSKGNLSVNELRYADMLEKNRKEIIKKLFVKISDCPQWMQEFLYEFRKKQLKKEAKKAKINLIKFKICDYFRKIFLFIK